MGTRQKHYVIAWHYAGDQARPLLFGCQDKGQFWGCTFEVANAARFDSPDRAARWWISKHAFSDEYEHYLYDGSIMIFETTKNGMKGVLPL